MDSPHRRSCLSLVAAHLNAPGRKQVQSMSVLDGV